MTMIERVAASIVIAQQRGLDRNGVARTAIEAMRYSEDGSNCPEAVRIAGEEAYAENGDARAIFNAMIDQALKDEA